MRVRVCVWACESCRRWCVCVRLCACACAWLCACGCGHMCICACTYLLVHSLGVCVRVCTCMVARERLGHRHWAVWCGRPFFPRAPWRMASSHVAGVPCTPRALQAVQTAVPRSDVCSQLAAPCSGWELTASEVRFCGLVFWKVARPVCPAGAASQPWTLVAVAAAVWGVAAVGLGVRDPSAGVQLLAAPRGRAALGLLGGWVRPPPCAL